MHRSNLKEKAIALRQGGHSYIYISKQVGISKSTLSGWLADVPFEPNQETLNSLGLARSMAAKKRALLRQEEMRRIRATASKEISKVSKRDLFVFGLGVYLGEGSKTNNIIRISNADPLVIRVAVAWFLARGIPKNQLAPRIFTYPDNDEKEDLRFWSKTTSIPESQFLKTYIDRRQGKSANRKGKLPHGTLHLGFRSGGKKELGVLFFRKIQAWNEEMLRQITADVV